VLDTSDRLVQKTDRSGFIEGEAFHEIKAFAQDALDWMARRRLAVAEKRREAARTDAPSQSARSRKKVERAIEAAAPATRGELQQAFSAYDRSREREVDELRKEVQLYRTLSTAGITAATFAHESSGNPLKVITQSIQTIERRAKSGLGAEYDQLLAKPVGAIRRAADALEVLGTATLRLVAHGKRRLGRVEVHAVIESVLETFTPFTRGRQVDVRTEFAPGAPYLRWSQAALESVITNLLNNSLAAFEHSERRDRRVVIRTLVREGKLELCVMDNGPGIEGISTKDIWLPGQTTRPNGTGLGLTIVRDTIRDLGGKTDAIEHGALGGAEFIVELPILEE
jgi:C4-dicarboxylate-specific signal transduction histidine kinase